MSLLRSLFAIRAFASLTFRYSVLGRWGGFAGASLVAALKKLRRAEGKIATLTRALHSSRFGRSRCSLFAIRATCASLRLRSLKSEIL